MAKNTADQFPPPFSAEEDSKKFVALNEYLALVGSSVHDAYLLYTRITQRNIRADEEKAQAEAQTAEVSELENKIKEVVLEEKEDAAGGEDEEEAGEK